MTTYECDSQAQFNDDDLPQGECDDHQQKFSSCMSNMANGWAVGGDHVIVTRQFVRRYSMSFYIL